MISCEDVLTHLDALVDGTLDHSRAGEVHAHLGDCATCRTAAEETAAILQKLRNLPADEPPARDLWPGIARRIQAERVVHLPQSRTGWGPRLAWLAAAATLVIASSVVTAYLVRQHPTPRPQAARSIDRGTVQAALEPATASFRSARTVLLDALAQRRADLDPQTVRVVDENLAIIDQAIARIALALDRDPNNRDLARLLASAYRREIDLLQEATELPSTVGGTT